MISKAFIDSSWHLNKAVTVSIITALLGMFGSLIGIYVSMREDIATIKAQVAAMSANDVRQERQIDEAMRLFRSDFERLRTDLTAEVRGVTIAMLNHDREARQTHK